MGNSFHFSILKNALQIELLQTVGVFEKCKINSFLIAKVTA